MTFRDHFKQFRAVSSLLETLLQEMMMEKIISLIKKTKKKQRAVTLPTCVNPRLGNTDAEVSFPSAANPKLKTVVVFLNLFSLK